MLSQNIRLQISLLLYLISLSIILSVKPAIFYNNDGSLKSFGTNKNNQTVFPLWMAIVLMAILSFYFSYFIIIII